MMISSGGQEQAGLLLLLLAPAFIYVTFQNFGNDSKWLILLCVYLLASTPPRGSRVLFNLEGKAAVQGLALVAFALILPSVQNMLTSPFRHLSADKETYYPMIANLEKTQDIYAYNKRAANVVVRRDLVYEVPQLVDYVPEDSVVPQSEFLGEELPPCSIMAGESTLGVYIADKLKAEPMGFGPETQFFTADVGSIVWMIGGFTPLQGSAPWYYSGTPGIENADAIIVPFCPLAIEFRDTALEAIANAGLRLNPPLRDDLFLVYKIVKDE